MTYHHIVRRREQIVTARVMAYRNRNTKVSQGPTQPPPKTAS